MGTTLTGTTPQDTYDSLIKVTDNGPLSATAKYLSDGLGNDSVLALSTGNIGIGTTNPSEKLDLQGTMNINAASGTYLQIQYNGLNRGYVGTANAVISGGATTDFGLLASSNLIFGTGGSSLERMRITSAGNVGIGLSNPNVKLDVLDTMRVQASGQGIFYLFNGVVQHQIAIEANPNNKLAFKWNGTERMALTDNGLTFNGDTAAANALDDYEEGTFSVTTAGDATGAFSDQRGEYTKIGNVVHFRLVASISSNFTSNAIGGLPFTVGGNASPSGLSGNINVANDNAANLVAFIPVGGTSVTIYSDHNTNNPASPSTTMGILRMFGTYRV